MSPPESTFQSDGYSTTLLTVKNRGGGVPSGDDGVAADMSRVVNGPPKTGLLGIRWAKVPGEIDSLNRSVDRISAKFVEDNEKNGTAIPPEVAFVLATGKPATVYKKRWTWIPLTIGLVAVAYLSFSALQNPGIVLASFLVSFIWYDLFSGILHVLHDNPLLMDMPVVNEPCLEFQWHHHIPHVSISLPRPPLPFALFYRHPRYFSDLQTRTSKHNFALTYSIPILPDSSSSRYRTFAPNHSLRCAGTSTSSLEYLLVCIYFCPLRILWEYHWASHIESPCL